MPKICKECPSTGPFPMDRGKERPICVVCFNSLRREQHGRPVASDADLVALHKAARKNPTFEALCDALSLAPKACRALLAKAEKAGSPVHVEHNVISIAPASTAEVVHDVAIRTRVGKPTIIGAISDTHLGSKYCMRGALRETVKWFYENGARDIVHSGDVLEGCYKHAQYELSHSGFDAQMNDAAKCFPELPGLRYHFVSGNHDFTFEELIGMRCGQAIEDGMRARGRDDWHCYGDRNAYLKIGGAVINLFHPRGSGSYARSYKLQKRIEGYSAIKPTFLFSGHHHMYCKVYERGIHAFQMPCFQGSGSNFAQSLPGAPAIGGILVKYQLSDTGSVYDIEYKERFYFERDDIFNPRNNLGGMTEVKAVAHDRRYRRGREVE